MRSSTLSELPLTDPERQQLQSQYAEIARLAGGLAHEIRNPLSTISLNLDLLVEDLQPSEQPRDRRMLQKLQSIQRECGNLERVLNDFLQFARATGPQPEPCDLNQLVTEFIEFFRPQALEQQIEISPHLASNLPLVRVDRHLIWQLFQNLARNALEATPAGGVLELQTYTRGDLVFLDVIDNGQGMDERTKLKMFEPFFSTKPAGSGLGLPTVRKIVEAHHGQLTCESAVGRGTKFSISLPGSF